MEKVKIKSAIDSGKKTKKDQPIINIELEDGRCGAGFDEKFKDLMGKEVELDIKEAGEYQGKKQHYFNFPKENTGGGKFAPKDYTFDKRRVAHETAVTMLVSGKIGNDKFNETRDNFFTYLNTK